jgi:carboxylesterase type B
VTIAGQSAGAGSVRALLASPRARGLFAAAIPGSNLAGYGYATTYSDYYTPEQSFSAAGQSILTSANCTDVKTASVCLSKVPAANLVSGNVARYVVVDGSYITTSRLDVRTPGKSARVPVLIGTTADDGAAFLSFSPSNTNRSVAISNALPDRPDLAAVVDSSTLFPTPSSGNATLDAFNLTARITTDVQFRCLDQATVHTAVRNDVWPTAWYYQFDRAYQTPNWNPNAPVCQPPPTTKYPLGDPSQPYMKWYSFNLNMLQYLVTNGSIP